MRTFMHQTLHLFKDVFFFGIKICKYKFKKKKLRHFINEKKLKGAQKYVGKIWNFGLFLRNVYILLTFYR